MRPLNFPVAVAAGDALVVVRRAATEDAKSPAQTAKQTKAPTSETNQSARGERKLHGIAD
jgi:hypothetical protein